MTDAKRAIEVLSNQANYSHCPDPPVPTIKLGYEAGKGIAGLIERQQEVIEQTKRERDEAVSALYTSTPCRVCTRFGEFCEVNVKRTEDDCGWKVCPDFEWRGVCVENGGTQ